ncbi:MAG: hypothetical protein QM820_60255 [Minicystis sp.]
MGRSLRRALGAILLAAVTLACSRRPESPEIPETKKKEAVPAMSDKVEDAAPPGAPAGTPLPVEPGSRAELLSSTHLFTVEITALDAEPWTRGADGLSHRKLKMGVKLVEILKGTLDRRPGEVFPLEVAQRRVSKSIEEGYHGLWSHADPEVGKGYLVISRAPGATSAPGLMREGVCEALLGKESAADVHLAEEGEQRYRHKLADRTEQDAQAAAARALIGLAAAHVPEESDLLARYLWARVEGTLVHADGKPGTIGDLLGLLTAPGGKQRFRIELIGAVEQLVENSEAPPERVKELAREVARAFFGVLVDPAATEMQESLVNVSLYPLVFPEDRPRLKAQEVLPAAADRQKARAALAHVHSEQAQKLTSWLGS